MIGVFSFGVIAALIAQWVAPMLLEVGASGEDLGPVVVINEIVTDPQQDWGGGGFVVPGDGTVGSTDEYIELAVLGGEIDLGEYWIRVVDSGEDVFRIGDVVESAVVESGGFLVIGNPPGSMNNDVRIELYDGDPALGGVLIDEISLGNYDDGDTDDNGPSGNASSADDESIARDDGSSDTDDGGDFAATAGTPGVRNPVRNHPPVADLSGHAEVVAGDVVEFDGSGSGDEDGDELTWYWDMDSRDGEDLESGDEGVSHEFLEPGMTRVVMEVEDEFGLRDRAELEVEVSEPPMVGGVRLSELLPNPEGPDEEFEFVEIENFGDEVLDLSGWSLEDTGGGKYVIDELVVPAGGFVSIRRSQSGIVLNNSNEQVLLRDRFGREVDVVAFEGSAPEGESYQLVGGEWVWSSEVSEGAENVVVNDEDDEVNSDSGDSVIDVHDDEQDDGSEVVSVPTPVLSVSQVVAHGPGDEVLLRGVVSVAPGVLGDNYVYVQDDRAGVRLAVSGFEMPGLEPGDVVEVLGKLSALKYEMKFTARDEDRFRVVGRDDVFVYQPVISELQDADVGRLVAVSGVVVKKNSGSFDLAHAVGDEKTVRVKKPEGFAYPASEGDAELTVVGVLTKTASGFYLRPRSLEDVIEGRQVVGSGEIVEAGLSWDQVELWLGRWFRFAL